MSHPYDTPQERENALQQFASYLRARAWAAGHDFRPVFQAQEPRDRIAVALAWWGITGIREVSPVLLANARMLGASRGQLLRSIYLPSAMSWVFASLHNAVGLAFVGAVVGEYLGSSQGVGYLILQAEGTFDINTVFAGIIVLTGFALVLDWLVTIVEQRLMTWQPRASETEKV